MSDLIEQEIADGEGARLLEEVRAFLRRFVVLSDSQAVELSLWVMHTHAFEAAHATPYQNISSAAKECGKTRLLEVLELLVATPWLTGRVSAAALVREIEGAHPTLLLDESDAAFARDKEYAESLREVLNMGHRRGGKATICVGQGLNITTKRFDVFCPKAIAGIGQLPDTVAGRSVPIRLRRRTASEKIERFRSRLVLPEAARLRDRLGLWAKQNIERLREAFPELPDALSDRQQDSAEPLLAIADRIGGCWPNQARSSFVELFARTEARDSSFGVRLLVDIKAAFEFTKAPKLTTTDLLGNLHRMETSPWSEFNQGKSLSPSTIASLLRPFDISPRDLRFGEKVLKGYERSSFEDAWARYINSGHPEFSQGQQAQQTSIYATKKDFWEGQRDGFAALARKASSSTKMQGVANVASPGKKSKDCNPGCWVHPSNKIVWWKRGDDPVCGLCHPDPRAKQ